MFDFLSKLLDTSDFPARWSCGRWTAAHGWLHILSDLGVWSAYVAIPCVLGFFLLRRKDIPFRTIFVLFGLFILACGTTHLMEVIIFWWPVYRLAGLIKLFTALVSWGTVLALVRVAPKVLAMRLPRSSEREVIARRAAEQYATAIQEERKRLRVTLQSIGDGVIATDAEGRVTLLNPIAEELTGWSSTRAVGQPIERVFSIIEEESRQAVSNPVSQALREGRIVALPHHAVLVANDGAERPIADSAAPIKNEQGQTVGVVLVFRDVTEQRRAELAERRNRDVLRLVHQIGKIGHWEWNSLTDENNWSPEIEALYGLPPGGFEGGYQGWAKLVHPDDLPQAEADVRRAMQTGEYFTEFRVIWPDGSVHWLETRASVFKDNHGKPVRIVGVNMDITERKRQEEALRASERRWRTLAEALQDADRRKDEFLATLAHELRNPLAPIRNCAANPQDAEGRCGDGRAVTGHDGAAGASSRPAGGRPAGRVPGHAGQDRTPQGAGRTRHGRRPCGRDGPAARGRPGARVERPPPARIPAARRRPGAARPGRRQPADERRQVHGAERPHLADGRTGRRAWRCCGSGTTASGSPRTCCPASSSCSCRWTTPPRRSQGGLGIGLTLVKNLVEMHNGTVEARSDGLGKGSEFVVRLPLAAQALDQDHGPGTASQHADQPPRPSGHRLLVVDDNQDAADSLAMLLRLQGHEVRVAYSGAGGAGDDEDLHAGRGVPGHRDAGDGRLRGRPPAAAAARPGEGGAGGADRLGPAGGPPPHGGSRVRPPSREAAGAESSGRPVVRSGRGKGDIQGRFSSGT